MSEKYVAKSYAATVQKYEELTRVIQGLSQSLSRIVTNQENEFIASYRVHMLQVALELKELQSRVEREEMYNDSVMLHIEEGMNWYKDQSKRLQKEADALNYEINVLSLIKAFHFLNLMIVRLECRTANQRSSRAT